VNTKKTITYHIGNPGPGLGQTQIQCMIVVKTFYYYVMNTCNSFYFL